MLVSDVVSSVDFMGALERLRGFTWQVADM